MDKYEQLLHRAKWRGLSVQENVTYEKFRQQNEVASLSTQDRATYAELRRRINTSALSPQEISMVADELQKSNPETNRYILLQILGYAGAESYRGLVEQFLECQEYPPMARLAIDILCGDWKLTGEYTKQVLSFTQGIPWDKEEDVRLMSISKAGEYLRSNFELNFLRELLHIFANQNERQLIREAAYLALARAMGRNWNELPRSSRPINWDTEFDPQIVREAKNRLIQELE